MGAVIVYVIVLAFVALRARMAREYEEFSVAKRTLPLALVFGSLTATYVGPGFSIGFVGKGFHSGFLFWIVGLAYAVQNISVGLLVAPKLRELKGCYTLGDAIGQKYGRTVPDSRRDHLGGPVHAVFGGDDQRGRQARPPRDARSAEVGLGFSSGGRGRLVYDLRGLAGERHDRRVSFRVARLALAPAAPVRAAVSLRRRGDSLLPAGGQRHGGGVSGDVPSADRQPRHAFLLGETLIPPYANLTLASKTTSVSRGSFILAGLFSTLWFMVMIALGIVARTHGPADTAEDHVLMSLVKTTMPTVGYALLLVTLVSVVLSSLNSLLNAGAVVLTQDILRRFAHLPDRVALRPDATATILIAGLAAAAAMFVPSVIKGLLFCYSIWAPAILPALVIGLWLKRPRPLAGVLSMIVGTLVAVAFKFPFFSWTGIPPILPALACSLLAYAVGHWAQGLIGRAKTWSVILLALVVLAALLIIASGVWVGVALIRGCPCPCARSHRRRPGGKQRRMASADAALAAFYMAFSLGETIEFDHVRNELVVTP